MGPHECIEGPRLRHFDMDDSFRIFQQCLVAMFQIEKMMACFPVLFQKKSAFIVKSAKYHQNNTLSCGNVD